MRLRFQRYQLGLMALAMMLGLPAALQAAHPKPLVIPLQCTNGDCPLLRGMPQTGGMRSGYVRLLTGATIGWHTSGQNEESLVILQGQGQAMIEGRPSMPFTAPATVYIPPATRHNIKNTGTDLLQYVYVVASAKE